MYELISEKINVNERIQKQKQKQTGDNKYWPECGETGIAGGIVT